MVQYTRNDLQNLVWMREYYALHDLILQTASDGRQRHVRCAIVKPLSEIELSNLLAELRVGFPDVNIDAERTADEILVIVDWS